MTKKMSAIAIAVTEVRELEFRNQLEAKQKEIEKRDLWIAYAVAALAGACHDNDHMGRVIESITRQSGHAAREIDKRYL